VLSVLESPEWEEVYLEQIVDLFVVDLQKGAVDVEGLSMITGVLADLIEQAVDCSWDESSEVLILSDVVKVGTLRVVVLLFGLFVDAVLPVATEHCVGFA
jgi:hypothetical protein